MFDYAKLNRKRFGRRLAIARTMCDLTQDGLAVLASSKQAIISRYEAGNAMPKDANLKKLAEVLGANYFWLKHGSKTTAEIYEEDGTKTLSVKYIKPKTPKKRAAYVNAINETLKELNDEDLQIVAEAAQALYLDANPKKLAEELTREEGLFKKQLQEAAEKHISNDAIVRARTIAGFRTQEPDLYEEYQKDPSNSQEILRKAELRNFKRYFPDLYIEVTKAPSPEERDRRIKAYFHALTEGIGNDSNSDDSSGD